MQNFRKLEVWKRSHKLTLTIYELSKSFPDDEKFGLTSQIRRATSSIPTNIAEGCGSSSSKEKVRFFQIAIASASEVDYLIQLCSDLGYFSKFPNIDTEIIEVKKMLLSLKKKVLTT